MLKNSRSREVKKPKYSAGKQFEAGRVAEKSRVAPLIILLLFSRALACFAGRRNPARTEPRPTPYSSPREDFLNSRLLEFLVCGVHLGRGAVTYD